MIARGCVAHILPSMDAHMIASSRGIPIFCFSRITKAGEAPKGLRELSPKSAGLETLQSIAPILSFDSYKIRRFIRVVELDQVGIHAARSLHRLIIRVEGSCDIEEAGAYRYH